MTVVRRQGIKNTIYSYIGVVLGFLSAYYIQPFFLTKEEIGLMRLLISSATIVAIISNLGSTQVIVKFLPDFYDRSTQHRGFFTIALFFPLVGFLFTLSVFVIFRDQLSSFYGFNSSVITTYFWPIMASGLFICMVYSFTSYCNAINKSSVSTVVNDIYQRIALIVCILLLSYSVISLIQFSYSITILYFSQVLLLFAIIKHYDHPTVRLSFFTKNHHLKKIITFTLITTFVQITGNNIKFIDVIFVGKYRSMEQVGIYSIAAFMGLVLEIPLNSLEKIASPKIARLFTSGHTAEIDKIYKLSTKYLMVFCGLLGCVLTSCVEPLLGLLPGDYSSGTWVTIIICIGAFFNSATGVNYSIMQYSGLYRLGALFYFLLLLVTCLLNIALVPSFGIIGAAIATASVAVIHNLSRLIIINRKLHMQPFSIENLKIVLAILFTLPVFFITLDNPYLLILCRASLAAVTFSGLIIILKVFTIHEIKDEFLSLKKTFF